MTISSSPRGSGICTGASIALGSTARSNYGFSTRSMALWHRGQNKASFHTVGFLVLSATFPVRFWPWFKVLLLLQAWAPLCKFCPHNYFWRTSHRHLFQPASMNLTWVLYFLARLLASFQSLWAPGSHILLDNFSTLQLRFFPHSQIFKLVLRVPANMSLYSLLASLASLYC